MRGDEVERVSDMVGQGFVLGRQMPGWTSRGTQKLPQIPMRGDLVSHRIGIRSDSGLSHDPEALKLEPKGFGRK